MIRTSLSRVTARDPRANVLIIHKPLEETANDASALLECGRFPCFLGLCRFLDLVLNFHLVVGKECANVKPCSGVERRDITALGDPHWGKNFGVCQMAFQGGVCDLKGRPCWVGGLQA